MKYPSANSSKKLKAIDKAMRHKDIQQLRQHCISHLGLVNDQTRQKAWPLLLGLTEDSDYPSDVPVSALKTKYAHQISVDIVRSMLNFDLVKGMSVHARTVRAAELTRVITRIVSEDPELHYYQGFHDICTVFLLVAGEELGYRLIHKFAYTHCREAMRPTFDQTTALMSLIIDIIREDAPDLCTKLTDLQQEVPTTQMPMFALSWVLTYFSHVVSNFSKVARIFDFCLATHPTAVLYLSAALIIADREEVMTMSDLPDLHRHFSQAVETADWDALCLDAENLMTQIPPKQLLKSLRGKVHSEYSSHSSPFFEKPAWIETVVRRTAVLATSLGTLLAFTYMRQYSV